MRYPAALKRDKDLLHEILLDALASVESNAEKLDGYLVWPDGSRSNFTIEREHLTTTVVRPRLRIVPLSPLPPWANSPA